MGKKRGASSPEGGADNAPLDRASDGEEHRSSRDEDARESADDGAGKCGKTTELQSRFDDIHQLRRQIVRSEALRLVDRSH